MHRIYLAFLCFFRILFGRPLPAEVIALPPRELVEKEPPLLPAPASAAQRVDKADRAEKVEPVERAEKPAARPARRPDVTPGALQLLSLLQREGRLVDFLSES